MSPEGIIREKERCILERVETEGNKTPRALVVIDWMLLLLKETAIHNRFTEKSNHLKVLDIVMAFKKNCGNIIKVRLLFICRHCGITNFFLKNKNSLQPRIFLTPSFRY